MRRSPASIRFVRAAVCGLVVALVPAALLGSAAASKPTSAGTSPGGHEDRGHGHHGEHGSAGLGRHGSLSITKSSFGAARRRHGRSTATRSPTAR